MLDSLWFCGVLLIGAGGIKLVVWRGLGKRQANFHAWNGAMCPVYKMMSIFVLDMYVGEGVFVSHLCY